MKKILLLLLLFSFGSLVALSEGHWVKVANHINRWYMSTAAYDSMNCAALSNFTYSIGRLELTSDGGNTWTQMLTDEDVFTDPENRGGPIFLTSVAYPSPNLIVCGGDSSWVLRSTDKGLSWTKRQIGAQKYTINRLCMADDKFGAAITKNEMYITTDGGLSWTLHDTKYIGSNISFWDISVCPGADSMLIAHVGKHKYGKSYIKTRDYGKTWELIPTNSVAIAEINFVDSLNGWAWSYDLTGKGNTDIIKKTTDGAKTWTLLMDTLIPPANKMIDMYFYNQKLGIYYGTFGKVLVTNDGGITWQQEYMPDNPTFYDLYAGIILSETKRYLFTNSGDIFKYETTTGVDEGMENTEGQGAAYYNAYDNTIRIPISLTGSGQPELSLYSLDGRLLQSFPETLVLGSSGWLSLRVTNADLAKGICLLVIRNGDSIRTEKILLY